MKILKSGIEIDPSQLNKIRGGSPCACGCAVGVNGEALNATGDEFDACHCSCFNEIARKVMTSYAYSFVFP